MKKYVIPIVVKYWEEDWISKNQTVIAVKQEKVTEESTKNKRLDKIFWFKVCVSLIFGVIFGVLQFKGFVAFLT